MQLRERTTFTHSTSPTASPTSDKATEQFTNQESQQMMNKIFRKDSNEYIPLGHDDRQRGGRPSTSSSSFSPSPSSSATSSSYFSRRIKWIALGSLLIIAAFVFTRSPGESLQYSGADNHKQDAGNHDKQYDNHPDLEFSLPTTTPDHGLSDAHLTASAVVDIVDKPASAINDIPDDQKAADTSNTTPALLSISTFEEDPDPSTSPHCTKPFNADKPIVQFALVIDAGSTGSRMHVYKFNNCGPSPALEWEVFTKVFPGLSKFGDHPDNGVATLEPLMKKAMEVVPTELRRCTPLVVKATAGLRLLGATKSEKILASVRHNLQTKYPFALLSEKLEGVAVMEGRNEGVYAWITTNYLLNTLSTDKDGKNAQTVAVLDLGGGSTQIVFAPSFGTNSSLQPGEHVYELNFGKSKYTLYQHSYLGYGLMSARRSVHNLAAFGWTWQNDHEWSDLSKSMTNMSNPCIPSGMEKKVSLDPKGKEAVDVMMVGTAAGYESCKRIVELVMAKDAICNVAPCSFNGAYQPAMTDTFPSGGIHLLSYFYDRITPLLPEFEDGFKLSDIHNLAVDICAGPSKWSERWGKNEKAMEELEGRPEYCLDMTFMHALLALGYELAPERPVSVGKQIQGIELGWALGLALAIVNDDNSLTCVQ